MRSPGAPCRAAPVSLADCCGYLRWYFRKRVSIGDVVSVHQAHALFGRLTWCIARCAAWCFVVPPRYLELHRRSEEHTSELQSLIRNSYAVFCLKKKKII